MEQTGSDRTGKVLAFSGFFLCFSPVCLVFWFGLVSFGFFQEQGLQSSLKESTSTYLGLFRRWWRRRKDGLSKRGENPWLPPPEIIFCVSVYIFRLVLISHASQQPRVAPQRARPALQGPQCPQWQLNAASTRSGLMFIALGNNATTVGGGVKPEKQGRDGDLIG